MPFKYTFDSVYVAKLILMINTPHDYLILNIYNFQTLLLIMNYKFLKVKGKKMQLPAFFPDATYGNVIGVNSKELYKIKAQGVVVNIYHLLRKNLINKIGKIGIHAYINFFKPIISDSGGFQVMSLIHDNPKLGKIEENKIIFNLDSKKIILTPEKSIQLQFRIKSDIIMCLDDCTRADAGLNAQKKSVERTIRWAGRCKKEFVKLTKNMEEKPLLFAIIQGGENKKLRKYCAEELLKIGFDGYAFGGFPVKNGKLLKGILEYTSKLIPNGFLKYAMGVGKPQDILECYKLGYNMFDCVIPTRDARHKRLYAFTNNKLGFKTIYIRGRHSNDKNPISKFCDCPTCKNHSLKDVYWAFRENREKANNLATIHNLRFYSMLMEKLRGK